MNTAITWLFILYQVIYAFAGFLGSVLVFIVIEASVTMTFGTPKWVGLLFGVVPFIIFSVICCACDDNIVLSKKMKLQNSANLQHPHKML